MKRIKLKIGAILMATVMIMTDRADILLIFYFSALLHEMGHLIAAKLLGIHIKEIRIDFSGARICTEDHLFSYKKEIWLSISGPLVNFLCFMACIAVFINWGISPEELSRQICAFLFDGEQSCVGCIGFFALSSFLQGAVNLLPIVTLDGGRMLFCFVAMIFGEAFATALLRSTSFIVALVMWTVSLYILLRVSSGLGIFVFAACVFFSTFEGKDKRADTSALHGI